MRIKEKWHVKVEVKLGSTILFKELIAYKIPREIVSSSIPSQKLLYENIVFDLQKEIPVKLLLIGS